MSTTDSSSAPGLIISSTEPIRFFLLSASKDSSLSQELREIALTLSSQPNVPYKSIRVIWVGSHPSTRPDLFRLFSGTKFVFTSPKPRVKSEELKQRLRKLAEIAEKKEYQELVKDIMPKKAMNEPFSSYKDQLGFGEQRFEFSRIFLSDWRGLHVALIMFTGYLVGYFAFRALFSHSPAMSAAGGILGLVFGMLVETLLFIIRTSDQDLTTSKVKKNY